MTECANVTPLLGKHTERRVSDYLHGLFPKRSVNRVLLVTPPDADAALFRFASARRGRYTNYPPYGLLVIATHLRKLGVDVRVLNLNDEILKACRGASDELNFDFDGTWQSRLDHELKSFTPDLVGITCMFTMTHLSFRQVCRRVKERGIPLAIGGVHVTNDVDRVMDDVDAADLAFLGEGELAFSAFVEVIRGNQPLESLGQLVLNLPSAPGEPGARRLRFTRDVRPSESDMGVVPAYDLIRLSEYSSRGTIGAFYCFKPRSTKFATVLSNRGCRAQCTFCSVRNFNGAGVRLRPVASVVDELRLLREEHGIGHITWLDDDLFKDHRRTISLFNEMVRQNVNVTWDATNGVIASSCVDEVVSAAAASGCIALNIGMESGNRDILRLVKKPGTVDTFVRAAEVLRKYETIHSSVFLMIGFPNETMAMILDTINVARQMDLDWYRISQVQPLPNTPLYDSMVAQGLIQPVANTELRFMGGAYGKQTEMEQGLRLATPDFEKAFSSIALDQVPTGDELTDIWFFMNYHLNFHRIFSERRPEKLRQLSLHLEVLGDVISPENGFALYFLGYLEHLRTGAVGSQIVERLRKRLETSPYWSDRFHAFGLSPGDLEELNFSNKEIPRLVVGQPAASTGPHAA